MLAVLGHLGSTWRMVSMSTQPRIAILIFVAAGIALASSAAAEPAVDFNRDIRPILSNRCFACHGPDDARREAGLRLDDAQIATHELESGATAIVPGKPEASELIARVTSTDDAMRMPPTEFGNPLTPREVDTLRSWIEQGARYAAHWSYEKPVAAVPPVAPPEWKQWPRNEIDLFALQAMQSHGLHPSPEADRYTLARRVFLDLTGLPPTVEEAEAFARDADSQAYEKLVDDLLHRPTYGEHWARNWLDLARYADSAGYADDPPRTIWAFRDWVIKAISANMPFDRFTIEQIAGDLLPNATEVQLIATAFHRNTMTNNEGGTQDEEFRNVAVVDRVNTTLAVWMGTTIACAQCHNHKYDPISQREFFEVFAMLNNTQDADRLDESPVLPIFSDEQRRRWMQVDGRIAGLQLMMMTPASAFSVEPAFWPQSIAALHELQPTTSVPIQRELPGARRETRIANRGNYLDPGPAVTPGFPAAFHAPGGDGPPNRLQLAKWLVSRENPLTARVIANRFWETLFGRGIVGTSEEFGSQGEPPTHPELLGWLAVKFMDGGWDSRALIRLMVTSAVYRQSSQIADSAAMVDPDNRWLARGPRVRMSAEMVRDQALAVSGLLSNKMYGPPVRPPQPNMGLTAAFGGSTDWATSEGDDRLRRAIYTTWRRSNPYPSMATFDAPNREVCTLRRTATNTPLQALVTLNDPVFVEASQGLARRAIQHSQAVDERIAYAFRRCLLRPPTGNELKLLEDLYRESRAHLAGRSEDAVKLATNPLGELPPGIDAVDAASMTAVCNVLLNLDEMFLKR
ncbi:MAG: PSD1 and planctomycete cytochrome C domain-containing protein [Planctomycetes bacterium]|nr:PSD1 and planctomycete cytochrome C domain-containing protein [Planctomycetota bacterium]